jgi:UDP-N-acetylmuramoyl-L-alanyl-D-glutamate--2,6-diaminopimelate ligase
VTFKELLSLVSSKKPPRIQTDSRLVKAGDIFVAVKGTACDGHDFIEQAIADGAEYIVCRQGKSSVETITVDDTSEAAAVLAQARCGNPASQLTNLAVTGTNGKTTVAYLVRSCIRKAGHNAASWVRSFTIHVQAKAARHRSRHRIV